MLYACVLEAQQLGRREHAIRALEMVMEKSRYNPTSGVHLPALLRYQNSKNSRKLFLIKDYRCLAKLIRSEIETKRHFESDSIDSFCKVFESGKNRIVYWSLDADTT